jgi:CRP-like cAMP-binding protein
MSPPLQLDSRPSWRDLAVAAGLDERELRARCVRRRFRRGEVVFHEGDPAGGMHLVEQGHVAVKLTTPLGEIGLIDILHPGDTFGEQSLVDGVGIRTATVVAIERAETLALDVRSFRELRQLGAGVDQFLLTVLGVRLQATSHQLLEALYLPAEIRVLRCVERLRIMFSADADSSIPLTQFDVAEMAGVTRSTANRLLRKAQESGLIRIARGQIDVRDVAALRRKAGLKS